MVARAQDVCGVRRSNRKVAWEAYRMVACKGGSIQSCMGKSEDMDSGAFLEASAWLRAEHVICSDGSGT